MSVTVTYSNGKIHYTKLFNLYFLIFVLISVIVISTTFSWFIYSNYSIQAEQFRLATTQSKYQQQEQAVISLRAETNYKVALFAKKVGEMQAEINRLNMLGGQLAKTANLTRDEFDFSKKPSSINAADNDNPQAVDLLGLLEKMDLLSLELNNRAHQLSLLETLLVNHNITNEVILKGRPTVQRGTWLSSPYGIRKDPFTGKATMHKGIDFAGKSGMNIIATGAGIVTWAGKRSGYGLMVEINHGNGISTRYAHAKKILTQEGDVVGKGQTIAVMGNTGRSTGPHVHYEVLKSGRQINPKRYIYR